MSGSFRPEVVSNAGQSWFVSTSNRQKLEIVLDCPENVVLSFLNLAVTFGCLVDADRSREAFYIVCLLFFIRPGSGNFRRALSFETQLAVVCQKVFIPFVQSFRDFHNFTFLFSL